MGATQTVETAFAPVILWNLEYPNETIADRRLYTPKDDPAAATEYQFVEGSLTVYSQDDLDAVLAICGSRVVREDIPATADPLICSCGKATRSSRFYQKHMARHLTV